MQRCICNCDSAENTHQTLYSNLSILLGASYLKSISFFILLNIVIKDTMKTVKWDFPFNAIKVLTLLAEK